MTTPVSSKGCAPCVEIIQFSRTNERTWETTEHGIYCREGYEPVGNPYHTTLRARRFKQEIDEVIQEVRCRVGDGDWSRYVSTEIYQQPVPSRKK